MTINDGRTMPRVAIIAPGIPPVDAYECCHVDRKRPGSAFAQCDEIDKLRLCEPTVLLGFILYHCDHGITAAEGERADLQERKEQVNQYHCFAPFA